MSKLPTPNPEDLETPNFPRRKLYIDFGNPNPEVGVTFEKDDINANIKRKFGSYIGNQTSINQFPIEPMQRNLRTVDRNGQQIAFMQHNADEQSSFLGEIGNGLATRNFESEYSGLLNVDGNEFKLDKQKQVIGLSDGDKIFQEINNNKEAASFPKRISVVLKDNNQTNPDSPLLSNTNGNEDNFTLGSIKFKKPGESAGKRKFPNVINGSSAEKLTIKELKTMGLLMMLQGTGEINQPKITDPNAQDAIATYGLTSTMVPGMARLGGRVNASRFKATNVIKAIKPNFEKEEHVSFLDENSTYSYGNVNNYFVPFDGLTGVPNIISATILFSVIAGALGSLSFLGLVRNPNTPLATHGNTENRRKWLGKYKLESASNDTLASISRIALNQKNILEFVQTEHEFFKCLNKGISVFFGVPGIASSTPQSQVGSALLGSIGGGAASFSKLHGYYNTVLRNIVRDINGLIQFPFEDKSSKPLDAMDIRNIADPIALVKKLNNSSIVKFINILITIGDKALTSEDKKIDSTEGLGFLTNSDIDSISEELGSEFAVLPNVPTINPAILRVKNKLNDGHLAMSNGTIKSMFLIPPNLLETVGRITDAGNVRKLKTRLQNNNIVIENSRQLENEKRIKADIVKRMEDYLELDYLPFYFHDIRTNEITSFHAFLDNINDSLSAEYVETEGYGRVGKIYTYKNTNRDISFSFKLFATNDNDFNDMWFKINKLATLLYPQWTEGRRINFPSSNGQNYKFIQPFSQIPGASPLIRLRAGDLWKTNYSKLAVSRLFGFGNGIGNNGAFNIQGMEREADSAAITSTQRLQTEQRAQTIFEQQTRGVYEPGSTVKLRSYSGRIGNNYINFTEGEQARILRREGNTYFIYRNGTTLTIPVDYFIPDIELITRDIRGATNSQESSNTQNENSSANQNSETINTFFNSERNYIMKAFESTKGRGLAGFIKSFKLNFENATWMTDVVNCRAPKLVTIDIDFAPIHDIQPGIDSNGFMTAPIWNVGKTVGELSDQDDFRRVDEKIKTATSYLTPSYARQGSDNTPDDQRSLTERVRRGTITT